MAAVLPICLLLVLLLAVPLILFKSRRPAPHRGPGSRAVRLPPGPWALPVIGHLHHLAGALPHRALRDLSRRHGPLMMLRLGELDAVVASSPDAAREIMKTHDASFASRPLTSMQQMAYGDAEGLIFAPYGDAWRQLRKICTVEILSSRRVQSFRPAREEELGRLLRSVAAASASSSPVNLTESISAYVADSTVRAIVGSRFKQRDTYLKMLQEGLKIVPGMTLPDIFPSSRLVRLFSSVPGRMQRHSQGMKLFMDTIIQEHQENSGPDCDGDKEEDLLDVLLRLQKEGDSQYPLTTDNIKTVMLDMFGAGSETSATTLQWAMAELIRNPRVMRKAQDEVRQQLAGHGKVREPVSGSGPGRAGGGHGDRERVGDRHGPGVLGRARGVRAGAVRAEQEGLQGDGLRVRAVRRREEDMPRHGVRAGSRGARARGAAVPLRLGTARRGGGRASGHDGGVWCHGTAPV
ncbi:hypothetical protein ACQJBY_054021 [Aegilops geniculata]